MKSWLEILQMVGIVLTIIVTLFGWPVGMVIKKWDKERESNTKKIEDLSEKMYDNEKDSTTRLNEHSVSIAELKSGKVSHEQLREAVADMREAMKASVESLANRMDQNRREDKEDLRNAMDDLKEYIRKQ